MTLAYYSARLEGIINACVIKIRVKVLGKNPHLSLALFLIPTRYPLSLVLIQLPSQTFDTLQHGLLAL